MLLKMAGLKYKSLLHKPDYRSPSYRSMNSIKSVS